MTLAGPSTSLTSPCQVSQQVLHNVVERYQAPNYDKENSFELILTGAEDVVPKMLVSARAAAYGQERSPAAASSADSAMLALSALPLQAAWLPRVIEWLRPGWTHFSGLNGGHSVSVQQEDDIPYSTAAFQSGNFLNAHTVADVSNEHMSTTDGISTHRPQQAGRLWWLGQRLKLLQDASALALSSLQWMLPSYPELAHFAQRTYLRALPQDPTLVAASRAARDTTRPEQRCAVITI